MSWFQQRFARRVQQAAIERWLERARVAEAIVWWAGVEDEAIWRGWELCECLINACY